jgi:hypothetical protein
MTIEESIKQTLDRAYKDMDPSTGMFPADWACKVCGKTLNADGNHPAELYAGTFTGLCYTCERGGPYVVPGSELPDGGRRVSHPPACPSWRRDRTDHWGYPDCENCKGQGAKMRHTAMNQYLEYCKPCMARVMAPRKRNEIEFLRGVATSLERDPLTPIDANPPLSQPQATVSTAAQLCATASLKRWADQPLVWQPQRYILREAESRMSRAQFGAKRAETLRRHLVAALRAEADEREAKA